MKSRTISLFIDAPASNVYTYASNPENLPLWVQHFCKSVELINSQWVVESPAGHVVIQFAASNNYGVLDHTVTLPDGEKITNPMRVIPNEDGCEIFFTLFQRNDMSDQQLQKDAELVLSDLHTLRRLLEHPAA